MAEIPAPLVKVVSWLDGRQHRNHAVLGNCPRCGKDCTTIGIVRIAYTFGVCDCDAAEYAHLTEQLWHRTCLTDQPDPDQVHAVLAAAADALGDLLREFKQGGRHTRAWWAVGLIRDWALQPSKRPEVLGGEQR